MFPENRYLRLVQGENDSYNPLVSQMMAIKTQDKYFSFMNYYLTGSLKIIGGPARKKEKKKVIILP